MGGSLPIRRTSPVAVGEQSCLQGPELAPGTVMGPGVKEEREYHLPPIRMASRVVVKLTGAGGESRFVPDHRGGGGRQLHCCLEP